MFRILAAVSLFCCVLGRPVFGMTAAVDHPGALPILLGLDKVRAALKLDSLQRALLDSLRDEYKSAARELTNPMPTAKPERVAAEKKLLRLNEHFNRRALSVLNDAQRARLSVIEAKLLGATLVYAPGNQKMLRLTEGQKRQVEAIRQRGVAYVGKINRQFEEGKISYQQRLHLLRNRRLAQGTQILRLLTAQQRNAVQELETGKFPS